ncbi:MAG: hypothetical protein M3042_06960, partial [Actinomycetota bacterium]|nr:hypothetical protein [Actinomycetota bacterium]
MLTRLLRQRRNDDAGTAALVLVVTVASGVLFGFGAMAVDLGNAYARKRATRTSADVVALAGAQGLPDMAKARTLAIEYLKENPVQGAPAYSSLPANWDNNEATPTYSAGAAAFQAVGATDGEIDFYGYNHAINQWVPASSTITATRIRVVVPPALVDFGLGQAVGFTNVKVRSAA